MEAAVLDVMNRGLARLEAHPLLAEPPAPAALPAFEAHALVFARAFGRHLERRVARNFDREIPELSQIARVQLRIHQPFPRALEAELVRIGRPRAELEGMSLGPAGERLLGHAEAALEGRDHAAAHVLLVSGLECLTQLLARHVAELVEAAGGDPTRFEHRHDGHESLVFMGLRRLSSWPEASIAHVPGALEVLFEDAAPWLDEWLEGPPPTRPQGRRRRRATRWGTGDLPTDVA